MIKRYQQGATLIVVMILLVAITVIGTVAIRKGLVSLNVATNSQIQQLLLQNSDAAFFNSERQVNIQKAMASNGMFGYLINGSNQDKELVFCFRGLENNFFDITKASIIQWQGNSLTNNAMGLGGFCNVDSSDTSFATNFTSGRRVVMTQVAVKYSSVAAQRDPFSLSIYGTDGEITKMSENVKPIQIFVVSLMPSLIPNEKIEGVNLCLNSRMNDPSVPERQNVTDCLAALNVPFTSHVTEYVLAVDFE